MIVDDRRPWYCFGGHRLRRWPPRRQFPLRLLFEADHIRVSSKEACHLAGQFRIERLVMVANNAPRQQRAIKSLARNQLLRQILYADAFRDRDAPRDGLWLVESDSRGGGLALHRALLHTARHVALARAPRGPPGRLPDAWLPEAP